MGRFKNFFTETIWFQAIFKITFFTGAVWFSLLDFHLHQAMASNFVNLFIAWSAGFVIIFWNSNSFLALINWPSFLLSFIYVILPYYLCWCEVSSYLCAFHTLETTHCSFRVNWGICYCGLHNPCRMSHNGFSPKSN